MAKPPLRPPSRGGGPITKTMLTWAFLLLLAAAAQAQSAQQFERSGDTIYASTGTVSPSSSSRRPQAGRSPAEIPHLLHDVHTVKFRSTDEDNAQPHKFQALAPAREISAVRAPLAKQSVESAPSNSLGGNGGLSLPQARLLQDWEAENIVLLATIDGLIHARDRKTGVERWSLGIPDSPMIRTTHHCHNESDEDGSTQCDHDYIFIVEPTQDGNLYIQHKNPQIGLQRLGITVRGLAERTPHIVEDPPLVTIAEQSTTAYVVDAASGNILQSFSKSASFVNDNQERSCRRVNGFELDGSACDPIGTLNIGRVEYTITIRNKKTTQLLCTIKFAEWLPNKGDEDLQAQYADPLDSQHIQTFYDGRIIGLNTNSGSGRLPQFNHALDSPVARVFDVVRPIDNKDNFAQLVVLARPIESPQMSLMPNWQLHDLQRIEKVFVDRTESGDWYCLSELSYPGVTRGASSANLHWNYDTKSIDFESGMDDIIGVHMLSLDGNGETPLLTIGGRLPVNDVVEEVDKTITTTELPKNPVSTSYIVNNWSTVLNIILLGLFLLVAGIQLRIPAVLKLQKYLRKAGIEVAIEPIRVSTSNSSSPVTEEAGATTVIEVAQPLPKMSDVIAEVVEDANLTPVRSRAQSTATTSTSPKKGVRIDDDNYNSSDGESDDDRGITQTISHEGQDNSSEPRRRHAKRGKRGGKKNRKKKQMDPDAMDEIEALTPEVPTKDGLLQVGKLRLDTREDRCLGRGSNGTAVFPGTLDGREVAVKRLIRTANSLAAKEIKHLLSSDENQHVIRYFGKEESQHFTYIALELFATSLDQFVEKPLHFPDLVKLPEGYDVKDCLRQITDGVAHLHSLKLVHRDIKPQNVLVKAVKSNRPTNGLPRLQFVISDFGLCKPLEEGPESTFAPTANHTAAGTTGWRAPELLVNSRDIIAAPSANSTTSKSTTHSSDGIVVVDPPTGRRATKAIDIFSLGCVFYYVMTQGRHPFDIGGTSLGRDLNIKENKFSTDDLRLYDYQFDADDLIMQMLNHDPKQRPDTAAVLNHPYFWDVGDKLEFLCDVSDCYEKEKNSIKNIHDENAVRTLAELDSLAELAGLESLAPNVIGPSNDFLRALPRSFINEMGKQRKYTGSKMIDLLRVIRNKKNHFHDLPEDVKEQMLGGSAKGYYEFWVRRFPSLLINCHCIILERDLVERFRMERWYPQR